LSTLSSWAHRFEEDHWRSPFDNLWVTITLRKSPTRHCQSELVEDCPTKPKRIETRTFEKLITSAIVIFLSNEIKNKMAHRLKFLLVAIIILSLPQKSVAEITWIDVGVNGLTCSMCTRSVEMSILRLDFVDSVSMGLENTEGRVFLKKNSIIDLPKIAKAVVNAGFSVRFVRLGFDFKKININTSGCFTDNGYSFQWLDYKEGAAQGFVRLKLIDEGFLPKKEAIKWKREIGSAECSSGQNIFHVVYE
jgi:copper chaperone CopZ